MTAVDNTCDQLSSWRRDASAPGMQRGRATQVATRDAADVALKGSLSLGDGNVRRASTAITIGFNDERIKRLDARQRRVVRQRDSSLTRADRSSRRLRKRGRILRRLSAPAAIAAMRPDRANDADVHSQFITLAYKLAALVTVTVEVSVRVILKTLSGFQARPSLPCLQHVRSRSRVGDRRLLKQ